MKLIFKVTARLLELSNKLHEHGNHNIARGTNHIHNAWNLNPKSSQ